MESSVQAALATGLDYVNRALSIEDSTKKQEAVKIALEFLMPLASPEQQIPKAAFGIGWLAEQLAIQTENSSNPDEEGRRTHTLSFFALAAEYYEKAASMPDYEKDLTPARAKHSLAALYELGVLENGFSDIQKAFALRFEAAEAGYAEAQMDLSVMYYAGEGAYPSLTEATRWMGRAWGRRHQLSPEFEQAVTESLNYYTAELTLMFPKQRPDLRPASCGLG